MAVDLSNGALLARGQHCLGRLRMLIERYDLLAMLHGEPISVVLSGFANLIGYRGRALADDSGGIGSFREVSAS
jgi:hypothetical protein